MEWLLLQLAAGRERESQSEEKEGFTAWNLGFL